MSVVARHQLQSARANVTLDFATLCHKQLAPWHAFASLGSCLAS